MTDIPAWLMTTVTPLGALIGFVILVGRAIIKGDLMPDSTYDRLNAAHRSEVETLTRALEVSQEHVSALSETAETTNALLTSLMKFIDAGEEVS